MVSSFIGMAARRAISYFRSASLIHSRGLAGDAVTGDVVFLGLNSQPKTAKALVLTSAAAVSAFLSYGGNKFITEEARLRRDMEAFELWMKEHNKVYASPEEKMRRFQIFTGELRFTEERKLKLNASADMTDEEYWNGSSSETPDLTPSKNSSEIGIAYATSALECSGMGFLT